MGFSSDAEHESDNKIEMNLLAVDEPTNILRVIVSMNGSESTFKVKDLKKFYDLEDKLLDHYPELYMDSIDIYYFDDNLAIVQITNSSDLDIFLETRQTYQHIYVIIKALERKRISDNKFNLIDAIFWSGLALFCLLFFIAIINIVRHRYSHSEQHLDQWSQEKKIIGEFCHSHSPSEHCQNIMVDFLSFMSFDFLAHTKN